MYRTLLFTKMFSSSEQSSLQDFAQESQTIQSDAAFPQKLQAIWILKPAFLGTSSLCLLNE